MNEFLVQNIEWVITMAFMAGGGWFMLHNLSSKIDAQTKHTDKRFDELAEKDREHDEMDKAHDMKIGGLQNRVVKLEADVSHLQTAWSDIKDWMVEMRRDIHKLLVFKGSEDK